MKLRAVLALFLLAATAVSGRADEGIWMPSQIREMAAELDELGIKLDPSEISRLDGFPLGAIVQTVGCTGSFVSADGLILTNFHCASPALSFNSTPERNLSLTGFLAKTRDQELWSGPGTSIYITTSIDDVTSKMMSAADSKLPDDELYRVIDRRERAIISECEKGGGVRCRVVPFFDGLRWASVRQQEIRDVRLAYAPSSSIGAFGGDEDNFMWPRHAGDFAFFRAYVGKNGLASDYHPDNVPFRPRQILRFSTEGIKPGEPVLVPGYPGKTMRYKPAADVRRVTEVNYPITVRFIRDYIGVLEEVGRKDEALRMRVEPLIVKQENALKYTAGALAAVRKTRLLERRSAEEGPLKEYLRARKDARGPNPIERIEAIQAEAMMTDRRDSTFYWMFRSSPLLNQAVQIYRFSLERRKKDSERQWGYQDRDLPRLQDMIERSRKEMPAAADRAGLSHFLREAASLPDDSRITPIDGALAATGAETTADAVELLLASLYSEGDFLDAGKRLAMLEQSTEQLDARKEPFLQLAKSLVPFMQERERINEARYASLARLRPPYMEGLMAWRGGRIYPDANGTVRISLGKVRGYSPRDGVMYAPQTTLAGLLEKNRGTAPFAVPQEVVEAAGSAGKSRWVDPQLGSIPLNFLTDTDLTAGSSGSPTLNAEGEIVGILFDGNYEAMASDFAYDEKLTRSIHVDTRFMFWFMESVDDARHLLREIGIAEH